MTDNSPQNRTAAQGVCGDAEVSESETSESSVTPAPMTLCDFLSARLDEDYDASYGFTTDKHIGGRWVHYGERMRAEIKGKRSLLAAAGGWLRHDPDPPPWAVLVMQTLALPYADHPDYREEWKP